MHDQHHSEVPMHACTTNNLTTTHPSQWWGRWGCRRLRSPLSTHNQSSQSQSGVGHRTSCPDGDDRSILGNKKRGRRGKRIRGKYARICENTRQIRENTQDSRQRGATRRVCEDTREYARIRENTREYAGYAADTRANTRGYAVNTQDTHKDIRRIRENTRRIFTVRRRVFAYGFGYITH